MPQRSSNENVTGNELLKNDKVRVETNSVLSAKNRKSYMARVAVSKSTTSLRMESHPLITLPITWGYTILFSVMTITLIAPLRLVASAFCLMVTSVIAYLAKPKEKVIGRVPSAQERILQSLVLVGIRLQLFCMGVHHINVIRKGSQISKLIVSNHVTCMDSFILAWVEHSRAIFSANFFKFPFVGTIISALDFIPDKLSKAADYETLRGIVKEVLVGGHPDSVLVFPQECTSRQDVLTDFADWPFTFPNQYVTPVVLRFYNRRSPFTPWLTHNPWVHTYLLCCNLDNSLSVIFGEPVRPTGQAKHFKNKIQSQMCMLLSASPAPHGVNDGNLLKKVIHNHITVKNLDRVVVKHWKEMYHLGLDDIFKALEQFHKMDTDGGGSIDYTEFCDYFKLDRRRLKSFQLFRALNESGTMDLEFNEFLTAFAVSRKSCQKMTELLFQICDINGESEIGLENFITVFCNEEDQQVRDFATEFFRQIQSEEGGQKIRLTLKEWEERVKRYSQATAVESVVQNIFQQNHV